MMLQLNALFWQSTSFTGTAVLFVLLSAWWLYRSPLKIPVSTVATPSPRLANWLAGLLGVSAIQLVIGAWWDASQHLKSGEIPDGADFLWPPHIMIYSAFLLSFIVAVIAIGAVVLRGWNVGQRDPRQWVRRNPYVGTVALASGYALLSIPGDALWHALYGIDLTAWSPPHIMLGVANCAVLICAVGLLAQSYPAANRPGWNSAAMLGLLGLMLSVIYLIGVVEWELPGVDNPHVAARPLWFYPSVGGLAAFFTLALAKQLVKFRWAATSTAAFFYLVRLAITLALHLTDNVVPFTPLWFILGAVFMDAVPWERARSLFLRDLVMVVAFTTGYILLSIFTLTGRAELATFTSLDLFMTIYTMLVAGLLLLSIARLVGRQLLGERLSF